MTLEEKANAYDEAIKRAKNVFNNCYHEETKTACSEIFPALNESEDENLKNKSGYYKAGKFWKARTLWNATKDKIPQRVPNRYILQECVWNIGTLQQFADEIKNVQEVSLDYPIILDMNGNILDGAHRVVKAYLEGKDIDIVYLGDDEWPEPDYDEEKAVKESEDERIRKRILQLVTADISQDDITDYENRQMRAYLEKQKPSELEKLTKLREMAHEIREAYERGIEVGRAEPKPAWSEEDEVMLKEIISFFKDGSVKLQHDLDLYAGFLEKRLKSLRPQPHWKPSEEHLSALLAVFNDPNNIGSQTCQLALTDLYEQLKKL